MSDADADRRRGRKPHQGLVKTGVVEPGDEQGAYSHAQLIRMNNRFRTRLLRAWNAARRTAKLPLIRSRRLFGEIVERRLELLRCRLRCLGAPFPRRLLVLAPLALADEFGPQLTLPTAHTSP